jgi:hypothetical protein
LGRFFFFFYTCVLFEKEVSPEDVALLFHQKRPTFDFKTLASILTKDISKKENDYDERSLILLQFLPFAM